MVEDIFTSVTEVELSETLWKVLWYMDPQGPSLYS